MKTINRRHVVTFQSRSVEKDTYGQKKETFTDLVTLYAEVDRERSDERGYERDVAQSTLTITCRPVQDLRIGDRAVVDSQFFNITNIRNKSRTWLEVEAEEVV